MPRQASSSPERTARLLPLGPGHGRGIGDATMSSSVPHAKTPSLGDKTTSGGTIRASPAYREVRESRGLPNISIPPANVLGSIGVTASQGYLRLPQIQQTQQTQIHRKQTRLRSHSSSAESEVRAVQQRRRSQARPRLHLSASAARRTRTTSTSRLYLLQQT